MTWAAREGIASLFVIFLMNAATFVLTDKSLPFTAEVVAGIVSITVGAVGLTQARGYFESRQYYQTAQVTGQAVVPPATMSNPSTMMPGPPGGQQ